MKIIKICFSDNFSQNFCFIGDDRHVRGTTMEIPGKLTNFPCKKKRYLNLQEDIQTLIYCHDLKIVALIN